MSLTAVLGVYITLSPGRYLRLTLIKFSYEPLWLKEAVSNTIVLVFYNLRNGCLIL